MSDNIKALREVGLALMHGGDMLSTDERMRLVGLLHGVIADLTRAPEEHEKEQAREEQRKTRAREFHRMNTQDSGPPWNSDMETHDLLMAGYLRGCATCGQPFKVDEKHRHTMRDGQFVFMHKGNCREHEPLVAGNRKQVYKTRCARCKQPIRAGEAFTTDDATGLIDHYRCPEPEHVEFRVETPMNGTTCVECHEPIVAGQQVTEFNRALLHKGCFSSWIAAPPAGEYERTVGFTVERS